MPSTVCLFLSLFLFHQPLSARLAVSVKSASVASVPSDCTPPPLAQLPLLPVSSRPIPLIPLLSFASGFAFFSLFTFCLVYLSPRDMSLAPSSPSQVGAELCSSTMGELLADGLTRSAQCDVCGIVVGRHPRHAPPPPVSPDTSPHRPSASSSITTLARLSQMLPKWSKHSVCRTFLERIEQVLSPSGLAEDVWPSIFMFVIEDVSAAKWVRQNILAKEDKMSWVQACAAFTSHFQSSDHSLTLRREYQLCKQGKYESVQSYADRFTELASQLGYEDDSSPIIDHFLLNLLGSMQQLYHQTLTVQRLTDPSFGLHSLHRVIEVCIQLDVANKTGSLLHPVPMAPVASGSSATGGKFKASQDKHCDLHPDARTHTTSECRVNAARTGAGPNSSVRATTVCYQCGEPGHLKPNCPHRATNTAASTTQVISTATASTANATRPSGAALSSGATSPGEELRRSNRQTAPPKPYIPHSSGPGSYASRAIRIDQALNTGDYYTDDDGLLHDVPVDALHIHSRSMSVAVPPQAATNHVATAPTASPPAPLKSKHEVLFVFKDRVFHTLLDTGATKSCIDQALVQELQLPIAPAMGKVSFAQAGLSADRIGVTDPLQITSLVPVPSLKMPVRSFSHSFEVLPLVSTTCAYQFIVGTDLLPSLFPAGLPVSFFCPPQPLKGAIIPGAARPHPVQTSTSAALSAAEPGTAISARPAARPKVSVALCSWREYSDDSDIIPLARLGLSPGDPEPPDLFTHSL